MRKAVVGRTANVYFSRTAVVEPSQELRNPTPLQFRANGNISPGDELFIDYGREYSLRSYVTK